jgi:citryl-CoA synthetase large subunit
LTVKLFEKEAKELLERYGLETPSRESGESFAVKAQLIANNRADMGAVKFADSLEEAEELAGEMKRREFDGKKPEDVLIEEKLEILEEHYVSFLYDTDVRNPIMVFSRQGGTGIEDEDAEKLVLPDDSQFRFREFLVRQGFEGKKIVKLGSVLQDLFRVFLEEDSRFLEVNPLAETPEGVVVADAMMELEDDAFYRHERDYPERDASGEEKTERELEAEKIDRDDHQGVAGKYVEMDGDIGMMLAGGGASITNMDALIEYGGQPANYTEYGGNPTTEKVYRLSKVIMSKPGLNGLWHVGGTANNTDILRTMKGFVQALEELEPEYPIVIRRDGPHADEAFELLQQKREELDLNMKLYRNDTQMTQTAETLMEMVEEYRGGE